MTHIRSWRRLLFSTLLLLGLLAGSGWACVGKTLVIGATGTPQQQVLAELLALLIGERTGTTVKVAAYPDAAAAHTALLKADLDIVIDYTGVAQVKVLGGAAIAEPAALFEAVKAAYNEQLNLIWLKPFGFLEPRLAPSGTVAEAAPVVRKDTLKKFPALARLINKLGGAIDAETMARLEAELASRPGREVARAFLKANRFI